MVTEESTPIAARGVEEIPLERKALDTKGLRGFVNYLKSVNKQSYILYGMTSMPSKSKKLFNLNLGAIKYVMHDHFAGITYGGCFWSVDAHFTSKRRI